jgi:NAD(P)H-quinone oxidoreductase subunit 5
MMNTATMNETLAHLTAGLAAAGPLVLLLFGCLPAAWMNRQPRKTALLGATLAVVALALALGAAVSLAFRGPADLAITLVSAVELGIYFDALSAIVLVLVAFLLAVVARFSINYLAGDPQQGRFTKWLLLTGGSVLTLVISGNLLQFALAWVATSFSLHQLLVFYPHRRGAVLAARKKFLISRLGDIGLLAVLVLVYQEFHTWRFSELFIAAGHLRDAAGAGMGSAIGIIAILLVAAAMMKSAQFPFHSWLPDTMETPTPVSALMHAGIINAGGFLIVRLNPLVTLSPGAMSMLALFGAFTALFASLVMLTHASVKRSLAFSTVAQMGFMMLECGLGAFSLAVLHLVAHSLYKAHAFLASGSIVNMAKAAWTPTGRPRAHPLTLGASFAVAIMLAIGLSHLFGVELGRNPGLVVLGCAFMMGLAYTLWNLWCHNLNFKITALGTGLGAGIAIAYYSLHRIFARLLGETEWTNSQLLSWPGVVLVGALLALFLLVLVIQTGLPQWSTAPWLRAIYVHARNGFYFNTLANRCVTALWPVKPQSYKN